MVIFTSLQGQKGGLLGQWPTSYNIKRCPGFRVPRLTISSIRYLLKYVSQVIWGKGIQRFIGHLARLKVDQFILDMYGPMIQMFQELFAFQAPNSTTPFTNGICLIMRSKIRLPLVNSKRNFRP